ncbi:3655_t:CDS:2, partial [Dentiscutata erythropus]
PIKSSTNCCYNGKVVLAPLGNTPESIIKLLIQVSLTIEEPYLKQIHSFNSVFSFTSIGALIDPELANGAHASWQHGENTVSEDPLIVSYTLAKIEDYLRQYGKYLTDFSELPTIQYDLLSINRQTQLFAEELSFSRDEL